MPVGMWVSRTAEFGLVDVLAAGAAGAHGVGAHVLLVDLDLDAVVDHRIDLHARERGVPPRVRIERRNPHQAMHAVLGLQPAEGVVALDLDGRRLDARALALGLFQEIDLVAVLLRPPRVHAQQHAGPVLALGAAGAGVDLEEGLVGVCLAREQRLELPTRGLRLQPPQHVLGLADDLLVLLGLAEADHGDLVVEVALDPAKRGELVIERGALLHHALGARGVVPKTGILGLRVQLGEACLGLVEVKDASSAVPRTA